MSIRYRIYMTRRIMLLIIIEQPRLEIIIIKYNKFCFKYIIISLFNIWEEMPSLLLEIKNSSFLYITKVAMSKLSELTSHFLHHRIMDVQIKTARNLDKVHTCIYPTGKHGFPFPLKINSPSITITQLIFCKLNSIHYIFQKQKKV